MFEKLHICSGYSVDHNLNGAVFNCGANDTETCKQEFHNSRVLWGKQGLLQSKVYGVSG